MRLRIVCSFDAFVGVFTVAHDVDACFGLKLYRLGNRVGEAFFERCFVVVGLFVADFSQIRNHRRRAAQGCRYGSR
jgi:hypothetical protein